MTDKKIMKKNLILSSCLVLAAAFAVACNKSDSDNPNEANQRYFDAWRAIHYPAAVEKDGVYVIDDKPGTGLEWTESLPVTLFTYTVRNLDGTVASNTDEQWAKQLGTWNETYYYGPQVTTTGESLSYAGLDAVLDGMKQGGTRTAIIPSWMMTYNRYDSVQEYLKHETENTSAIYTITFLEQTENLYEYELRQMREYASSHWGVTDTLSTAAVFFKSFTEFEGEPVEMPTDTTVYINYIGRRMSDGQVFDTTIADTAKFYHIYDASKTYQPVSVTWAETATGIKLGGSSVVDGFAYGLKAMHPEEKASFLFGYKLGYSSSGSGNLIPPYAALRFDIEMVPEP